MEEKGFFESHNTEINGFPKIVPKSTEYGTMFRFRFTPKGHFEDINKLSVDPIRSRYLTISEKDYFINNTNLHSLPQNCVGVLVAYGTSMSNNPLQRPWNLGVIIYHSHLKTLILPATMVRKGVSANNYKKYGFAENEDYCIEYSSKDPLKIQYLNCIHKEVQLGKDGFIQSNVNGPDVLFNTLEFPTKNLYKRYKKVKASDHPFFSIDKMNIFHPTTKKIKMFDQKLQIRKKLDPTKNIVGYDQKRHIHKGFAFPYVQKNNNLYLTNQLFAIICEEAAKSLINQKCICIEKYNKYLDQHSIDKIEMKVYAIDHRGLSIEKREKNSGNRDRDTTDSIEMDSNEHLLKKKGLQIGYWKKTPTVNINDLQMLEEILDRTYGNFSFERSKTVSFGLNTYTGKPSAAYVRATPMAAKETVNDREYYRQCFDPTYHPMIYQLISELQVQAEHFQIAVDPIYDKFLRDVHCTIATSTKDKSQEEEGDIRHLLKKKKKRFADISIITGGNKKVSGYSNFPHEDADSIARRLWSQCLHVLEKYYQFIKDKNDIYNTSNNIRVIKHIQKRFKVNNNFPVYTTCGYRVFMREKEMKYLAYFLYNDLGIGIILSSAESIYHTFDASLVTHQTSVPICADDTHVYFKHNSFFIFAWGNGKSVRRLWLEERGYDINGNRVNITDFERYFQVFNADEQAHVLRNGWVRENC